MPHTLDPTSPRPLPAAAVRDVAGSAARLGLLTLSGRIETLSAGLADDLGFDDPADLRGLSVTSLWSPEDRAVVGAALVLARGGQTGHAAVDMTYLGAAHMAGRVTFAPGPADGSVLMSLDWTGSGT